MNYLVIYVRVASFKMHVILPRSIWFSLPLAFSVVCKNKHCTDCFNVHLLEYGAKQKLNQNTVVKLRSVFLMTTTNSEQIANYTKERYRKEKLSIYRISILKTVFFVFISPFYTRVQSRKNVMIIITAK